MSDAVAKRPAGLPPIANMRQYRFAVEYMTCGQDVVQAAIRAGYSAKTAKHAGARLLRTPGVQAALERLSLKYERGAGATLCEVVERLTGIIRDPMTETEHRLKAIAQLSKIRGWERPTTAIQINNTQQNEVHYNLKDIRAYDPDQDAIPTTATREQEPGGVAPQP